MPRRTYKPRPGRRTRRVRFRRRTKRKTGRPTKALVPSNYFFTRHTTEVRASLATPSSGQWHTDATSTSWYQSFQLNDLNDYTDYTNLFAQYRINAVKVTLIPQATEISQSVVAAPGALFSQLVVYVVPNPLGRYSTSSNITEDIALDTQAVKIRRWVNGKNLSLYTKVNQLGSVYNAPTNDYTKIRPKFISTDEIDTPHYGMSLLFVNQNGGSMPAVPCKIITKYYLQFRGSN